LKEGSTWIQAVVLIVKIHSRPISEADTGTHQRSVTFPEIHNMFQRNDRGDEFMIAEDPFEGLHIEHPAVIKDFPPRFSWYPEVKDVAIFKQEHSPAYRAGIEQLLNIEFCSAFQTAVKEFSFWLRNEVGPDMLRKLIKLHVISPFD